MSDVNDLAAAASEALQARHPQAFDIDLENFDLAAFQQVVLNVIGSNAQQSAIVAQQQKALNDPRRVTNWPVSQLTVAVSELATMVLGPLLGDAPGRDRLVYELNVAQRMGFLIEAERIKSSASPLLVASAGLDLSKMGGLPGGRR